MRTRHTDLQHGASPTKQVPVHAPGIRTDVAWAVKKKRTKLLALAAVAQLALPISPPVSDTSAGSSRTEAPRRQSSDAGLRLLLCYRRRRRFYTRRKFRPPCVRATTSILSEDDRGEEDAAQDDCGKKFAAQGDCGEEHAAQDDCGEEDAAQDDCGEEDAAQDDCGKEVAAQGDCGEEHAALGDFGEEHAAQDDCGEEDAAQVDCGEEDAAQDDCGKEVVAQGDCGEDAAQDDCGEDAAQDDCGEEDAAQGDCGEEDAAQGDRGEEDAAQVDYGQEDTAQVDCGEDDAAQVDWGEDYAAQDDCGQEDAAQGDWGEDDYAQIDCGEEDAAQVNCDDGDTGSNREHRCVFPMALSVCFPREVPVAIFLSDDEHHVTITPPVVEKSEESAPSLASPKAGKGPRSTKKKKDLVPPVSAALAGTIRKADGADSNEAEAAAAAAVVCRPKRQRKPKVFREFLDTRTEEFDWVTYYPNVPFPELGEVETISEGRSSDINSDSTPKPYSLKLQTDTQRTRKVRRILFEEPHFPSVSPPNDNSASPAAAARPLAKELASSMGLQTPDKLQESNGECDMGDRTSATPSESTAAAIAAAAADDDDEKDCSWTPYDDFSTRNAGLRVPSSVTVELEISGRTPERSRLLRNGFPESETLKAKDLKVKLKKKRPRPKVWRPEKVKVAKRAKIPKTTKSKQMRHRPARGAFDAAVFVHSHRAPASGPKAESSKRQRQNERAKPSIKSADSADSVPPAAEVPDISIAAEAMDNSMAMFSDGCALTVDLTNFRVPTMILNTQPASEPRADCSSALVLVPEGSDWMEEPPCTPRGKTLAVLPSSVPFFNSPTMKNRQPASEPRAQCSSALEQLLQDREASESTMEKTTSESDLRHRSYMDVLRCTPNFGVFQVPEGSDWMEELPCTPRANTLDVSVPFLNSPSCAPNENVFGGRDSSDSDAEQTSPTLVRRKRSTLAKRTRRSLLSAVELIAAGTNTSVAAPLCVSAPFIRPTIPFFTMTEERKRQHALALRREPWFVEDPIGLDTEWGSDAEGPLQLVVYEQKSTDMVVYQEMRPKVKYKPKVHLDSLTINTFERLMLQGGDAKDADHADEDWVAERKLWSARAHHFNGIMLQVQGDRAFSKWGGSVLDSVVGAFLTQNVSDFLSSNAFMVLRAHFPAREDARSGTDVPTEEQSSLTDEIIPGGELVNATGIDHEQENVCLMSDAGIQDSQVVTEVCTRVATYSVESQVTTKPFVNSPSRDEAHRDPDQLDPCSFSGDDRSAETLESGIEANDLAISLGLVHLESTSVAQGSCSSMEMTSPSGAGIAADEPVSANACDETPPITESVSEVPISANTEGHHSGTRAATAGNHSDMRAAQPGQVLSYMNLEEKFRLFSEEDALTPAGTGDLFARAIRAILGKKTIDRDVKGQRVPLKPLKLKKPRNKRYVDMSRFKTATNVRLLTGGERANYELKVNYALNSEQKVTWEALRANLLLHEEFGRDPFTADSVDWEAVRRADVAELANVIKERGMNNILGGRIKSLLDRIHREQDGSLDLEWVRKLSPISAQNFLTSVRGLGIKSVECIRLLTLHHPSFPVDTNVGRIVVRLGWVPLEPLPEESQLHLLEMYPVQEHIQKYIWPRLCTLDQQTLYEFHYQLITFGKVFCTKSKPNCNACPLRTECKHYESAYCSARPLLKGPEEPSNDSERQIVPLMSRSSLQTPLEERQSLLMLEGNARASGGTCIPIIEEPNSPEYVHDIEDIPFTVNCTDADRDCVELLDVNNLELEPSACGGSVVYVELNEMSTQDVSEESSIMAIPIKGAGQDSAGCIEDAVEESNPQVLGEEVAHPPSLELVLLPPETASFPAPQLKNVQRLRTIHYVYELPDKHPLLAKMDKRDPEDPCLYLLAIWNSDEVPGAMPKISDDDASNPFACCQSGEESVRGTLLVPCRTAMKGSFPLNGTYFQVNEVFADHGSSIVPIDVPRTLLWNLRRKFVYFGTSVTSIFKDMSLEEIQCCFKKGYICVRAFDQTSRQPKLLATRLHQSGAKIVAARAGGPKGRRASKAKVAS